MIWVPLRIPTCVALGPVSRRPWCWWAKSLFRVYAWGFLIHQIREMGWVGGSLVVFLTWKFKALVAQSCLCDPIDCSLCPWDSPGKNTGVGCHALRQCIFPTQWSKPGLPQYRQIFYHLSHQASPLEGTSKRKRWWHICDQQGIALPALGCGPWFHIKKLEWAFEWSDRSWWVRVTHKCGNNDQVGLNNMWRGTRILQRPPKCLGAWTPGPQLPVWLLLLQHGLQPKVQAAAESNVKRIRRDRKQQSL